MLSKLKRFYLALVCFIEEVICQINLTISGLFAGLIRRMVTYLPGLSSKYWLICHINLVAVETQTNSHCTTLTSQPAVPPDDLKIPAPASLVE